MVDKDGIGRPKPCLVPRPSILIVNYPSNPTAETVDLAFYERLVAWAKEQWLHLEKGGEVEEGQYDLLLEILQTLSISLVRPLSDAQLLGMLARLS